MTSRSQTESASSARRRLDHHPHQRLGAGGAQEHAAAALEGLLLALDRLPDRLGTGDRLAVGDLDVDQRLRQFLHRLHRGEVAAAELADRRQRRGDAVAGGDDAGVDDVARLLAAERPAALAQLVEHVAVADAGHGDLDPGLLHRLVEAVVAHHGDGDAAGQLAAPGHPARDQGDQLVAVVAATAAVDGEDAIAVAVEGEADRRLGAGDRAGELLEVGGAAALVDVAPVRLGADRLDRGAEPLEDRRGGAEGGAVGAVEQDVTAGEIEREGGLQRPQVVLEAAVQLTDLAGLDGVALGVQQRLDPRLGLVVELGAQRGEELDPVVAIGVVRGRDDRGEVETEALDQHRRGRRRQHATEQGVATGGGDPGGQRRLEHRPGLARVADDQYLRPLGIQRRGGRLAQRGGQLGREKGSSLSPDPIGSEELAPDRQAAA